MNSRISHVFTRRELHELVWSKPLTELAAIFGISDRGLAKICLRHLVPSPPRGYWAKLEAGHPVKITPLRSVAHEPLDRIEITSSTTELSDAARARFLAEASARTRGIDQAELLTPVPRAAQLKAMKEATPSKYIQELVEKPHKSVLATAKALRKARPDKFGAVEATGDGHCGVTVHQVSIERAITFLHNMALGLDERGLSLKPAGSKMKLSVGPDEITFNLTERSRRQKHVPTAEEQALYERNQARRERAFARNDIDVAWAIPYQPPWDEYDRIYESQLLFAVDGWGQGLRRSWSDGKQQTVEKMLHSSILDGLQMLLAYEKEDREEREERIRQSEELARRRQLLKLRRECEEKRKKYLQELIDAEREATYIRNWLASVENADISTEFGRMLSWAKHRLHNLEPLTDPEVVCTNLRDAELFPEVDELHDPLGDPPEGHSYW